MNTLTAPTRGKKLVVLLTLAVFACQNRTPKPDVAHISAARSTEAPILAQSGVTTPSSLPEDPEAGARSVAQWREHLRKEERERRLNFDRHRQREHRAVIQSLLAIRRSYARATSERAIRRVQERTRASVPKLERAFDAIDHWGVSSSLVPEYRKLVELFSESYPNARIAALSGDQAPLTALESDIAARFESIDADLREAVESEDE